ncbi:MAG: LysE family transporter [Candidatus Thorarchaeota archaeon]|jgi:threonine/homoserine/homoserine lactone efflux protein
MGVFEVLAFWWLVSLTGALAPGPLSAAVVMQASRRGRLHGILPMVGHSIVELGIITAIILGVQALELNQFTIDLIAGFGGIVVILFGFLALRDYKHREKEDSTEENTGSTAASVIEATAQGAAVSILSPYFLLWWFAIGLSSVTILVAELQLGIGTVFLAGVLVYLTHISTDFMFGAFLTLGSDKAASSVKVRGINWVNVGIGVFQVALGLWFIWMALV